MFFETPHAVSVTPRMESSRTGLVKVTHGTLTEEQVVQQLRRLVSATFNWSLVKLEEQVYKVDFPRREDLAHLLEFGFSRVPNSKCLLEFDECKKQEPKGILLKQIWVRFQGLYLNL